MSNITKIKIDNEREHSYQDFPANREFKKRAEDDNPGGGWPSDLPKPSAGGYGYTENEAVHKIDPKFIPEEYINQLIDVKLNALDGNGVAY